MMFRAFVLALTLFSLNAVYGQSDREKSKKVDPSNSTSSKWVITPVYFPNIILGGESVYYTYNSTSEVTQLGQSRYGITIDKFYPNNNYGFGTDLVFENINYSFDVGNGSRMMFQDFQIAVRPFFTLNNNKLTKTNLKYIDFGLDARVLVYNRRYEYANETFIDRSPNMKGLTTYFMLRVGQKKIKTSHLMMSKVGQSRIELDISLPLFELGNRIKYPYEGASNDSLYKAQYSPYFLTFRYAESIDLKARKTVGFSENKYPKSKISRFFLAPVNYDSPLSSAFGGFYVSSSAFSPVDTFSFVNASDTTLVSKITDKQISLGFNLGFMGNYKPHYTYYSNFWHALLSVGVRDRKLSLQRSEIPYLKQLNLESGLAFQYGIKNKWFLTAGYLWLMPLNTELADNNYTMLYDHRHFARFGIGFGHGINVLFECPVDYFDNPYRKFFSNVQIRFGF